MWLPPSDTSWFDVAATAFLLMLGLDATGKPIDRAPTMKQVLLVRLDPALERALREDPEYKEAMIASNWPRAASVVHRVVGRTVAASASSTDELRWGGYFVVDAETRNLVGSCGFKTPPTGAGVVEIAYFTYPEFEKQGYATEMARRLVALAATSALVRTVIAHTLPEANASTRVLQRAGMTLVGEVMDPDDGRVWRWEVPVDA